MALREREKSDQLFLLNYWCVNVNIFYFALSELSRISQHTECENNEKSLRLMRTIKLSQSHKFRDCFLRAPGLMFHGCYRLLGTKFFAGSSECRQNDLGMGTDIWDIRFKACRADMSQKWLCRCFEKFKTSLFNHASKTFLVHQKNATRSSQLNQNINIINHSKTKANSFPSHRNPTKIIFFISKIALCEIHFQILMFPFNEFTQTQHRSRD